MYINDNMFLPNVFGQILLLPAALQVVEKNLQYINMCKTMSATNIHCKNRLGIFPSPAGMSLTKLSLGGNNLIILGQRELGQ
jgi:hypothetical protein